MSKNTAFMPHHMEELKRLGMGGYPCATLASQEIEQLNVYVYALEEMLLVGFTNSEEVREMIMHMRGMFAPDVDLLSLEYGEGSGA